MHFLVSSLAVQAARHLDKTASVGLELINN